MWFLGWRRGNCLEMNRREVLAGLGLPLLLPACRGAEAAGVPKPDSSGRRPDVVLISIDDLNDWVGYLGGHPQASTPYLDAFAASGWAFQHAYCSAPSCNGSRSSVFLGLEAHRTRIVENSVDARPFMRKLPTIPQHFRAHGYATAAVGKVTHRAVPEIWDQLVRRVADPPASSPDVFEGGNFEWGQTALELEQMPDFACVRSAESILSNRPSGKPLFLSVGLFKPHLPWHLPSSLLNRFPESEVQLPLLLERDVEDLPAAASLLPDSTTRFHEKIVSRGLWRSAVRHYLAATALADEALGALLQLIEQHLGPEAIVVVWSDHGWHLGEKMRWRKFTLWEDATRVPLVIKPSSSAPHQAQKISQPVGLIDLFKTLSSLAGLTPPLCDGVDLNESIRDGQALHSRPPVVTSWGCHNHALRSRDHRYIRYADGSEELYDHRIDPHEWHNVAAGQPELVAVYADQLERLLRS